MIDRKKMTEIAEELQGTCKTIDDILEAHGLDIGDLSLELAQDLDDITMMCETCGWWCEPFEMEGDTCQDCRD
jgi:hypothetical protein